MDGSFQTAQLQAHQKKMMTLILDLVRYRTVGVEEEEEEIKIKDVPGRKIETQIIQEGVVGMEKRKIHVVHMVNFVQDKVTLIK